MSRPLRHRLSLLLVPVVVSLPWHAASAQESMAEAEAPTPAEVDDRQVQSRYDAMFGERERRARSTPTLGDDAAVAREVLDALEVGGLSEPLRTVMAQRAMDLASGSVEGLPAARSAAEWLIEADPDREAAVQGRLIDAHLRLLPGARADQGRAVAGEVMVLLMEAARARERDLDFAGARRWYTQAATLTTRYPGAGEVSVETLRAALTRTADLSRRQQEVAKLEAAQAASPRPEIAGRIAHMLLVSFAAVDRAQPHAAASGDVQLVRRVELAMRPVGELAAEEAALLGDWYTSLADEAATAAGTTLRRRALAAYAQFLEAHGEEDFDAARVRVAVKRLEAAVGPVASPTADRVAERAVDLMPTVVGNLASLVIRGDGWSAVDGGVMGAAGGKGKASTLCLPARAGDGYTLTLRLAAKGEGLWLTLPVGEGVALLTYAPAADGRLAAGPAPEQGERRGRFVVAVPQAHTPRLLEIDIANRPDDDAATITLRLDGEEAMRWDGSTRGFPTRARKGAPHGITFTLTPNRDGAAMLTAASVKGEVEPVPLATPPTADIQPQPTRRPHKTRRGE